MGKFSFLLVIAFLCSVVAGAQMLSVKGTLRDSSGGAGLAAAQVLLQAATDSSIRYQATTDSSGRFELLNVKPDSFVLRISQPAGLTASTRLRIDSRRTDLGTLQIIGNSISLSTPPSIAADSTALASSADSSRQPSMIAYNPPAGTSPAAAVNTTGAMTIEGILQDKADNTALRGVTVSARLKKDASNTRSAISDSKGHFTLADLPADTLILSFSSIGYELVDRQVDPSASATLNLGIINIPKTSKELEGVTVTAKTPPAQQKADTVQYNANAFKVNPDATTEDLIKKMPGITVDKDGTVTAHGDQVKKVTIDGKDFLGDDATAALRNLPSEVVDKIQVFDRLSDQAAFTGFDDGNSVKAINIVTKNGIRNGQFGRIYAGYGTDNRYAAGGNVSTFKGDRRISLVGSFNNINQQNFSSQDLLGVTSGGGGGNFGGGGGQRGGGGNRGGGGRGGGGIFGGGTDNFTVGQQPGISKTNAFGVNFTDKWGSKLDVQGSYFFNNSTNTNERELHSQTLISNDSSQFTDQNSLSVSKNNNHRFNMRLEYKFDSSNSLIITPSLNFQNNSTNAVSSSQTYYGANDTANTSESRSSAMRNGYNLRNNILYRHSFAKRGRTLSVNLGTTLNKNDGESYILQRLLFFQKSQLPDDSLQNQYKRNPTDGYSVSGNIAYTEPVGKKGQLQFNYSPSYSKNKADQQTFLYDSAGKTFSQFSPSLSNKFDNTITTNNGGISFRLGASRDNQFAVGVNLQNSKLQSMRTYPGVATVNQSFTNLLPNLMFRRKISARSSINIFYRASTNFPSVTQLQDVIDPSNPLRITSGNPYLKQAYTNFLSARYTFTNTSKGQSIFANVFLQTQSNYISNATYIATADSALQHGVVLKRGSQFSTPVNLDGYKSLRTFLTFSQPVAFIKSNVNLSTGFSYSRLPGLINYQQTITNNYTYNAGIVIASNISQYVDFNLSYNANFNDANSSATSQSNQRYVNQVTGIQFNLLSKSGWFIQNDLTN
ncbi:MAG TPA: outer membrane beta-barrel protein, partial [Chitinophagaceae bacterium]|nr:outer membrane beta-barrel protein [Chitinophagaceae bacterium]